MTKLLISVRDAAEAEAAIAGGADLIDVKEPRNGSLGRASEQVLREIADVVGDRKPLSAALGELVDWREKRDGFSTRPDGLQNRPTLLPPKYTFAKVGLAGATTDPQWRQHWAESLALLPETTSPVAVVYADAATCDAPDLDEIMPSAIALSCQAILVDTFHKNGQTLLDHWSVTQLREFIRAARQHHMLSVLAGSLDLPSARIVSQLQPDFIAVRSAVCRGGRTGAVQEDLVTAFAAELH